MCVCVCVYFPQIVFAVYTSNLLIAYLLIDLNIYLNSDEPIIYLFYYEDVQWSKIQNYYIELLPIII